ncbi:MAG: HAD family hydrolase [Alphaproteobacteria bacterium CG_4_9_14_3_um_filter_47_13]|nr:MAG: HAD family hydrolase [Alphaproteobacteria bacterium CG_4_9_14_3_um_filter_47_13]
MMNDEFPKAVLFDWDGTLVNTLSFLLMAHNHVREQMALSPWSVSEFKSHVRYSSRELYATAYGDQAGQAMETLGVFMDENHLQSIDILPDALELLECLQEQDIPSALISNKRHDFLRKEVSHLGWDHFFKTTIGAGYAEKDKPAPDPLLLALEECGLTAGKDIWYVGDSETDICAAHAAGCTAILVRHHHDNEYLIEEFNPEFVFDDCKALQNSILSYRQRLVEKG